MPTATLYRGSYGLSNRVPPELIPYNAETGVTGLQRADNVLIGEAGQIYCRQGSRQVFSSGSCHSPLLVPSGFLFVKETESEAFISFAADKSITGDLVISEVRQLSQSGHWLSWFELQGEYWFSTENERGIVSSDMLVRDWPDSAPYMEDHSDFHFEQLPLGRHVDVHGIHILSARGQEIYISEPAQPAIYRASAGSFSTAGPVRMLRSAQSGFFYSDDKAVWFVGGLNPDTFSLKRVLNYPAVEYCSIHGLVSASDLGFESSALGVVFMTTEGPVFGFPDGTVVNLTEKQFKMPSNCGVSRGSMMIVNKSNLIISLE